MRKMRSIGKSIEVILTLLFILIQGIGLSIPESAANELTTGAPRGQEQRESEAVSPKAATPERAGRILSVQVEDEAGHTVIRMIGDGPFRGYQFRKLKDDRFLLELPGIVSDAPRASVPSHSKRVQRIHLERRDMKGVHLTGMLQVPLARHALTESGNNLILTLYPAKDQPPRITHQQAPQPVPQPTLPLSEQGTAPVPAQAASIAPEQTASPEPLALQPVPQPIISGPVPEETILSPGVPLDASPQPLLAAETVVAERTPLQEEMQAALGEGQRTYVGKLISLDLQDADLINVLRLLADVSGMNIVIEPGVAGKVTLKVDKIPWDQVLDMVLAMNALGMEEVGGIIRIASKGKLQAEMKERESLIKAKQEQIKARQELIEAAKDFGEITTAYLYISYAPPGEVAAKINEIKSEKGKVSVDPRTKLVIFTDYPGRIQTAKQLIDRLDRPTPQVLIEARIVQVALNASKALGFSWNFNYDNTGSNFFGTGFEVNLPTSGNTFTGFNLGRIAGQTLWDLDLRISALEQAGSARVISSPKVVTLDGVSATITQGTQIPYQQESESGGTTVAFKDATLELKVTPSITPDNRVRMQIDVKKDQPGASTGGDVPIDTRKVQTELLVESGTIVVIGGVIEESITESEDRTPVLSRVPVLGHLFRAKQSSRIRTELLVFISPQIVETSKPKFTSHMK